MSGIPKSTPQPSRYAARTRRLGPKAIGRAATPGLRRVRPRVRCERHARAPGDEVLHRRENDQSRAALSPLYREAAAYHRPPPARLVLAESVEGSSAPRARERVPRATPASSRWKQAPSARGDRARRGRAVAARPRLLLADEPTPGSTGRRPRDRTSPPRARARDERGDRLRDARPLLIEHADDRLDLARRGPHPRAGAVV